METLNDVKLVSAKRDAKQAATMGIPAINACAVYSYGFSNIHRQLAKAKAESEGRLDISEDDVAATAMDACKAFQAELEHRQLRERTPQRKSVRNGNAVS